MWKVEKLTIYSNGSNYDVWFVTDGNIEYQADSKESAEYLKNVLNNALTPTK